MAHLITSSFQNQSIFFLFSFSLGLSYSPKTVATSCVSLQCALTSVLIRFIKFLSSYQTDYGNIAFSIKGDVYHLVQLQVVDAAEAKTFYCTAADIMSAVRG